MNKTAIEWVKNEDGSQGYTINPVKGLCPMACSYCYAIRMYKRFKWNPEIRMEPDWAEDLPKKPSRVFVGSTMELFGDWVEEWMWEEIWKYVNDYPQHTFIFLTKQPQNLIKWSPFPGNCWVGASATNSVMAEHAGYYLSEIKAKVKFVSFEPLQEHINSHFAHWLKGDDFDGINWLIIGQQTPVKQTTQPKMEWIQELLVAAHNANVPVFMKNNLEPLLNGTWSGWKLRQEFPQPLGKE